MGLPSPISQRAKRITSPEQVGPVAREGETGEDCVLCPTRKVMARAVCELVGRAWRTGGVTSGCEAVDEEGPLGERSSRRRRGGGAGAVRKGGGRGGQGAERGGRRNQEQAAGGSGRRGEEERGGGGAEAERGGGEEEGGEQLGGAAHDAGGKEERVLRLRAQLPPSGRGWGAADGPGFSRAAGEADGG
jgi:hypothetical protein